MPVEALSTHGCPLTTNRGNGYPQPNALAGYQAVKHGIFPNFDCKPSGGQAPDLYAEP